jgi:hypothetical protein
MKLIDSLEKHQLMVAVRTDTPDQAFKAAEACIKRGQVYRNYFLCA